MNISFSISKKQFVYAVFVLEILLCAWCFGLISLPGISSQKLAMTQMEHELCISAFEIVAADIDHFESGNDMLAAYLQNCPVAVRDKLENLIGCPTRDNFVPKTQKILQNVRIE